VAGQIGLWSLIQKKEYGRSSMVAAAEKSDILEVRRMIIKE